MDTSNLFSGEEDIPDSEKEDQLVYTPEALAEFAAKSRIMTEARDDAAHPITETQPVPLDDRVGVDVPRDTPGILSDPVTEPSGSNSSLSRSRPKPRPAIRPKKSNLADGTSATPPAASSSSAFRPIDIALDQTLDVHTTIADRAKTRTRKTQPENDAASSNVALQTKPPPIRSDADIIELTSDDEWDELAIRPSKNKRKTKSQTNTRTPQEREAHSSAVQVKQRPKPRPRKSTARVSSPSTRTRLSQSSASNGHDPARTYGLPSADLPPSDPPPMSTFTDAEHPPIAILPPETELDALTSSPGSLFSPIKDKAKARSRPHYQVDELQSDDAPGLMLPPPAPDSTFFCGSSPPPPIKQRPPAPDLADLERTNEESPTVAPSKKKPKATPKGRKPRKKKAANEEEPLVDFVEGEIPAPKTKKRGKGKAAAKPPQVEVVIPVVSGKFKQPEEPKEMDVGQALYNQGSLTSLSPAPDSDMEELGILDSPPKKRKSQSDHEDDCPRKKTKAGSKPASTAKRSIRGNNKQVIQSDDELAIEDVSTTVVEDEVKEDHSLPLVKAARTPAQRKPGGKERASLPPKQEDFVAHVDAQQLGREASFKENMEPEPRVQFTTPAKRVREADTKTSISSQYSIAPKGKSTPMSELIKRANSLPGSPFPASTPSVRRGPAMGNAYSPFLKSSKSMLSRIAPLHPNRRTPPPPPPARKKTKKELEREEKWEEELVDSVGGIQAWACMTDAERKELRKAKWSLEMNGWED